MRLRKARERAGLTQGQVAEYTGIGKQYISKLERGANEPPTWELLAKLARQYRTSTDYLLGMIDDWRPPENKTLPEGGSEMLEYLSGMSDRGRADLLAVARVLYQSDQELCDLRLRDYEPESGRLLIRHGKGNKKRTVFLGMSGAISPPDRTPYLTIRSLSRDPVHLIGAFLVCAGCANRISVGVQNAAWALDALIEADTGPTTSVRVAICHAPIDRGYESK